MKRSTAPRRSSRQEWNDIEHETLSCPVHGEKLVMRKNPDGDGTFWACRSFESKGCRISWSDTYRCWYGNPLHVARASSKRSRATSKRALLKAQLEAVGLPPERVALALSMGIDFAEVMMRHYAVLWGGKGTIRIAPECHASQLERRG